ncbi:HAD family hydrolase [Acrocarpospora sp. B8E8]|uniref:HAD family hydrolase n=1 Tax=Acrocarpospora sp. B8E8 TaxID=3153572 RepID=UPI00325E19C4
MVPRAVLLTDLDNTLFSWIDYFAPSIRAMVGALSSVTGVPADDIYPQLREVFRRHNAAEHPRVIRELKLYHDRDPVEREEIVRLGQQVFDQARSVNLKAYPGVVAALTELRNHDVVVVGVTSSSVYDAVTRIEMLGLAPLLDTVIAWQGIPGIAPPDHTELARRVVSIPTELLKPSCHPYQMALERCDLDKLVPVWVVGDSIANDLIPARAIGARTVWARYGHAYERVNFETILRVTFWDAGKVKSAYDSSIMEPDEIIDDFGQIVELMLGEERRAATHFDFAGPDPRLDSISTGCDSEER